tara:strand:+ start:602 stop:3100 length:2499 start_codon:yes stop_codon:yes gene_type:complete
MLIKTFKQISKTDTLIAGGKGASLGEMTQAGIPVPEGFVVLSDAFDRFIEETDLNVEIDAVLDGVNTKEIHTVENASEKIKGMILSKEMPEDIKTQILECHKKLNCKFVAVRSSATSEDSASAAWAGQLDSFLNTTKETLLENVKKCWASLFTPRAIFYRFEKKLSKDKISVAVVVQKMVDSEESGIAFSVHPVTQDENQIIIEAGFGLGEAIVSGSITPDSYVIDKQGFSILDINVNEQTKALYKKAKSGNEWKALGEKGNKQVLTEKEIVELSRLIVKIENHYGFPCDIEWAKEKEKFHIVQSRPITTLANSNKNNTLVTPEKKKQLPRIVYDQTQYSSFHWMAKDGIWISEEVYDAMEEISGYKPNRWLLYSQAKPNSFFFGAYDEEAIEKEAEIGLKSLSDKKFLEDYEQKASKMYKETERIKAYYRRNIKNKELELLRSNPEKIFDFFKNLKKTIKFVMQYYVLTQPQRFYDVEKKIESSRDYENLILLMENGRALSPLAELRLHFLNYAKKIKNSGLNPEEFNKKNKKEFENLKEVLDRLGFLNQSILGGKYFDLDEMNRELKEMLKNWDDNEAELKQLEEQTNKIKERNKIFEKNKSKEIYQIAEASGQMLLYRITLQTYILSMLFYYVTLIDFLNKINNIEKLDSDAYSFNDLLKLIKDGRKLVKKEIEKRQRAFLVIYSHEGTKTYFGDEARDEIKELLEFREDEINKAKELEGKVASWKSEDDSIKGRAFVLTSAFDVEEKLKEFHKGDFLVATQTHPNLVPVMKKAGAIITDEGGLTCHAAIVSRELGKPCLIGTRIATKVIKTGDNIKIDKNGVLNILKK